jgi:GNAT superfamily N-acetyltransferase
MTACSVRFAIPDDVKTLVALCSEHASFEHAPYETEGKESPLAQALFDENPRLKAWVALVQEHTVGYATATEEFSTWYATSFLHMDCLFVRSSHRNTGIGARLLQAVVQYARDRGLQEVQWQTPDWNTDACRFYQRHGAIAHRKFRFRMPIR